MIRPRPAAGVLAALAAFALSASPLAAAAAPSAPQTPSAVVLGVQTYNLDFGADLQPLFSSTNPVAAASAIWAEMVASDIPARADAVARQIVAAQPDLVGLQEVSIWSSGPVTFTGTCAPPPGTFAGCAVTPAYDALELLLADLAARGTPYQAVTHNTNFSNAAFPLPYLAPTAGGPPSLRVATFTDRDVILVRASSLSRGRIALGVPHNHTYRAMLPVSVAGQQLAVPRGWSDVDVMVRGRTLSFANTHLEAYGLPGTLKDQYRNLQSEELAEAVAASPHPVVLVGDFNARPDMCVGLRPGTDNEFLDQNVVAYQNLVAAGLLEAWPLVYPETPCGSAGWTSGQSTLDNASSTLDHRIDDVFVSAGFTVLSADVVGDLQADRTAGGLWPSDHASTVAKVRLDRAAKG